MSFHRDLPPATESTNTSFDGLSIVAKRALSGMALLPIADEIINVHLTVEKEKWARTDINKSIATWQKFDSNLVGPVPASLEELAANHPNFSETIDRLYGAWDLFAGDDLHIRDSDELLYDNMQLQLIPWQSLFDNLPDITEWINKLRAAQNPLNLADKIDSDVLRALKEDTILPSYRHPDNPDLLITTNDYLNIKLDRDGPWGVMLIQTSGLPSIEGEYFLSADDLMEIGDGHYMYGNYPIDAMGILEWMAHSVQMDFRNDVFSDYNSLLLANKYPSGDSYYSVPYVHRIQKGGYNLASVSTISDHQKPRHVMPRWAVA